MKKIIVICILIVLGGLIWFWRHNIKTATTLSQTPTPTQSSNSIQILSTNPNPLEAATLLPNQSIEFNFNHSIVPAEFKHHFDPQLDDIVTEENNPNKGIYTLKISFKKPLELGSGYTLFIQANTDSRDGLKLGQDYSYHFKTISYNGV